jgi:hypothetical protein
MGVPVGRRNITHDSSRYLFPGGLPNLVIQK